MSGRGELHLTILLENMRREGYEMAVSRPRVVFKDGRWRDGIEPFEMLTVDVEEANQGGVMEELGRRTATCRTCSRTARAVCVWSTAFRHAA